MRKSLISLFAVAVSLPVAFATGAAQAQSYNWTGAYIGIHGGYAWSDVDWTHQSTVLHFNPNPNTNSDSFSNSGWIGGGQIGFQQQYTNWVIGLEATLSGGDLSDTHTRPGTFSPNQITQDVRLIMTVTARLGYTFDRSMVYVKGGYAGARLTEGLSEQPFFTHSVGNDSWHNGWTIGAGFEYAFTRNLIFGLEYNYIDLESRTFSNPDTSGFALTTINVDPSPIQTVMARLSFKFGPDFEPAPLK